MSLKYGTLAKKRGAIYLVSAGILGRWQPEIPALHRFLSPPARAHPNRQHGEGKMGEPERSQRGKTDGWGAGQSLFTPCKQNPKKAFSAVCKDLITPYPHRAIASPREGGKSILSANI